MGALRSADCSSPCGAASLAALLAPLAELVGASSIVALTLSQRAFLVQIVELAVAICFGPAAAPLPLDELTVQLACKTFIDLCLRTLDQVASEPPALHLSLIHI